MTWSRNCKVKGANSLGCKEYQWENGNITVVECLCDTKLCNEKVALSTSTTLPTTTDGICFVK